MFDPRLWHHTRPKCAPANTLLNTATMRGVDHEVYVLTPDNFERAETALALCLMHGLLPAGRP